MEAGALVGLAPPAPGSNPARRPASITHIKVGRAHWSWPTGDEGNRPGRRGPAPSQGGHRHRMEKKHPEQMKQQDVNSLQTQLSTWRGGIASYRATLNKTCVKGLGEVWEAWRILPTHLRMPSGVGLKVSGRRVGGCRGGLQREVSQKQSPNVRG